MNAAAPHLKPHSSARDAGRRLRPSSAPSPFALDRFDDWICPACRGSLTDRRCGACGRRYRDTAGLPDFRIGSDRYLTLDQERARAEELARLEPRSDVLSLASSYYEITGDPRRERFLDHIACAEARGEPLAAALAESVGSGPGPRRGRVLEVGCGTGGLIAAGLRRGLRIVGVDIASRWLVVARRRLADRGLAAPLVAADSSRLPWRDSTFDAVVGDSVLEHLDDPESALREWRRVLRPGGLLLLWSPNRRTLLPDPHVGLWGLGWMPAPQAQRRVERKLGAFWLPRTRTASEAARLVRASGFTTIQTTAPEVSPDWAETRSAPMRRAIAVYRQARRIPIIKTAVRALGPLWELRATTAIRDADADADADLSARGSGLDIDDPRYFDRLADAERRHWWPSAMRAIAEHWLSQALRGRRDLDALDAGCGAGATLAWLSSRAEIGRATGMDVRPEALAQARRIGDFRLIEGSVLDPPFADESFDVIVCLDVLQHLPAGSEARALSELRRMLRPDGWLLLRTNAPGWLRKARRPGAPEPIRRDELRRWAEEAGLTIDRATHANALPSLAAELRGGLRRIKGRGRGDEHGHPAGGGLRLQVPHPMINRILTAVGRGEAWLAGRRGVSLPRGHSLLALARRASN